MFEFFLSTNRSLDDLNDWSTMSAESRQYLRKFWEFVLRFYGPTYLNRQPSKAELDTIVVEYEDFVFKGCVGANDWCKIASKNCSLELKGQ